MTTYRRIVLGHRPRLSDLLVEEQGVVGEKVIAWSPKVLERCSIVADNFEAAGARTPAAAVEELAEEVEPAAEVADNIRGLKWMSAFAHHLQERCTLVPVEGEADIAEQVEVLEEVLAVDAVDTVTEKEKYKSGGVG
jgi:hypothetical protein